ncbi:MAG: OmpA family protein, partial [Alcanivoracaceae bacterium]
GGGAQAAPSQVSPEPAPQPVAMVSPAGEQVAPAVQPVTTPGDSDADGVPDESDLCPDSAPGETVNSSGCSVGSVTMENILFASNSALLTQQGREAVEELAQILKRYPDRPARIEAHTDSQGAAAFNLRLSAQRARSVFEALVEYGVDPARLSSQGLGETQPVADNSTAEGRARNRRVELRFIEPGADSAVDQ